MLILWVFRREPGDPVCGATVYKSRTDDACRRHLLERIRKAESHLPHARTLPPKNEIAGLRPTSIPLPMKAGVHSMIHPQFSIARAALE